MILVSMGLPAPRDLPSWAQRWVADGSVAWIEIEQEQAFGSANVLADGQIVLWWYRAPWSGSELEGDTEAYLEHWLKLQRAVLRTRNESGGRLVFLNADVADHRLVVEALASLVEPGVAEALIPRGVPHSADTGLVATSEPDEADAPIGLADFFAFLYREVAPEFWDVFEVLESVAIGSKAPLLRDAIQFPDVSVLLAFHEAGIRGLALPQLESAWNAERKDLARLLQEALTRANFADELERSLAEHQSELHRCTQALLAAKTYSSQQQFALHEAQQRWSKSLVALQSEQHRRVLAERVHAESRALELLESQQAFEALALESQRQLNAARQAASAEQAASANARAELEAELVQVRSARNVLLEQVAHLKEEATRQAEVARADLAAAHQESANLLGNLHRVQEELEAQDLRYQTESNEATQQVGELQKSAAVLQTQLEAERAGLAQAQAQYAQLREQSDQLATSRDAERNAFESELKSRAVALREAEERAKRLEAAQQQYMQRSEADLKASREESDLLLTSLHQVQEEYEALYLRTKDQEANSSRQQGEQEQQLALLKRALDEKVSELAVAKQSAAQKEQLLAQAKATSEKVNVAFEAALAKARDEAAQSLAQQARQFEAEYSDLAGQHAQQLSHVNAQHEAAVKLLHAQLEEIVAQRDLIVRNADAQLSAFGEKLRLAAAEFEARQAQLVNQHDEQLSLVIAQHEANIKSLQDQLREVTAQRDLIVQTAEAQLAETLQRLQITSAELERFFQRSQALEVEMDAELAKQQASYEATIAAMQAESQSATSRMERALSQAESQLDDVTGRLQVASLAIEKLEVRNREVAFERDQQMAVLKAEHDAFVSGLQQQIQVAHAQNEQRAKQAEERYSELLDRLQYANAAIEGYQSKVEETVAAQARAVARLARLQQQFPQAIGVDRVELASADSAAEVPSADWRILGLLVRGEEFPMLRARTSLVEGKPGLAVVDAKGNVAEAATLVPQQVLQREAGQLALFMQIGTRELRRLAAVADAISVQLKLPMNRGSAPEGFDPEFWRESLVNLPRELQALPAVFRYDAVRLKREKRNPDYEHVWLSFDGASFGDLDLPEFEVRLSAADVAPGRFARKPKIEIPLCASGKPPFEGWFKESTDDYGDKLEIRADLDAQAFDLAVWGRLPAPAQAMLLSLIAALPQIISRLTERTKLSRQVDEWQTLVTGLMQTMRQRLQPTAPAVSSAQVASRSKAVPESPNVASKMPVNSPPPKVAVPGNPAGGSPFAQAKSPARVITAPAIKAPTNKAPATPTAPVEKQRSPRGKKA